MNRLLVILLLLLASFLVQAKVYKIIDADGNVTYSQTKPADADNIETIKTPKAPPVPPAPTKISTEAKPNADSDQKSELSPEEKEKVDAENAEIKKQNCKNSKKLLAELNSAGRVKIKGDDGNIKWAAEEEIQARKEQLQGNVDKWCK